MPSKRCVVLQKRSTAFVQSLSFAPLALPLPPRAALCRGNSQPPVPRTPSLVTAPIQCKPAAGVGAGGGHHLLCRAAVGCRPRVLAARRALGPPRLGRRGVLRKTLAHLCLHNGTV